MITNTKCYCTCVHSSTFKSEPSFYSAFGFWVWSGVFFNIKNGLLWNVFWLQVLIQCWSRFEILVWSGPGLGLSVSHGQQGGYVFLSLLWVSVLQETRGFQLFPSSTPSLKPSPAPLLSPSLSPRCHCLSPGSVLFNWWCTRRGEGEAGVARRWVCFTALWRVMSLCVCCMCVRVHVYVCLSVCN